MIQTLLGVIIVLEIVIAIELWLLIKGIAAPMDEDMTDIIQMVKSQFETQKKTPKARFKSEREDRKRRR